MSSLNVKVFSDGASLSHFAAGIFADIVSQAVSSSGRFLVALSGGGTPMALYRLLAAAPYRESLPWARMHFFWGDERCVSPDDEESSYHQALQGLLGQVPIPEKNIFRARGELGPQAGAADYARQLQSMAQAGMDWPSFDLVLLGLGADGHTASLFPGSAETKGQATVAVTAHYQDRPANRISLTPDVFNFARNVIFLATGAEKSAALAATLAGARDPVKFPAQRIAPSDGSLLWLVDAAAASQLPDSIPGITIQR
jgi:6-phosphogluconolactonase